MTSYKAFEEYPEELTNTIKEHYSEILKGVGEDVGREGIVKTPERAAKAIQFLTSGYTLDPEEVLRSAIF